MKSTVIDRRQLLKSTGVCCVASALGMLPFISACSKAVKNRPPQTEQSSSGLSRSDVCSNPTPCTAISQFTIVLHGLFLIERWPEGQQYQIRVVTPDCSNLPHISHRYMAGSWGMPLDSINDKKDYESGWSLGNGMTTDFNLPEMKHQVGKLDLTQRYLSLSLPYPKSIKALRVIPWNQVTANTTVADFPLVTALIYGDPRPDHPPLPVHPSSWDRGANFHIFAEPNCTMDCRQMIQHSGETLVATKRLLAAYDVKANSVDCPPQILPDTCPAGKGVPGVRCEEEKSLWELGVARPCADAVKNGLKMAVNMPTCASVILTGP